MKKRYIKDGKTYFTPIQIPKEVEYIEKEKNEYGEEIEVKKIKSVIQFTNDEKIILDAGYEIYTPPKVSLATLLMRSNNIINQETDNKILNEFIYKDNAFYLTMENQTNFANLFMAREYLEYPQKVKTKTGFIDLNSKEEITEFYLAGVNFVKQCLEEGWQRKAEAEAQIRADYETTDNA